MDNRVAAAIVELQTKTLNQIQSETGYTWAYRALAAKYLGLTHDAVAYSDEAVEHAALCGDDNVLHDVRQIIQTSA